MMKSLNEYIEEAQTKVFDEARAFFAFGKKQFDEKKQDGVKYVDVGYGLICPKEKTEWLINELENIHKRGIEQDIKENGVEAIIHRELANYETQITGDITAVVDALESYGITEDQIKKEYKIFFKKCVKNDLF